MKKPWYHPLEICFDEYQCLWMIVFVLPLDVGEWPSEDIETGYVGKNRIPITKAYYVSAIDTKAELDKRMESIPQDPKEALIEHTQSYYESYKQIIEYQLLTSPAKRALNYISVNRRRKLTYPQWRYELKRKRDLRKLSVKVLTK